MRMEELIKAAQDYDLKNRPKNQSWARVPDSQVARLLNGARLAEDNQRQGSLTDPGD